MQAWRCTTVDFPSATPRGPPDNSLQLVCFCIHLDEPTHSVSFPAIAIPPQKGLTQQEQLPYELLLHIFSYLDAKKDIATLCRCSRVFRDIAEVNLYRNMDLDFVGSHGHSEGVWKALRDLRNHHYANLVTELRVKLQVCNYPEPPQECHCGPMDLMLGAALRSMNALEVLGINCNICDDLSTGRHQYLSGLPTRKLRELTIDCACTLGAIFDKRKFLTAQCMRSVTALNWGAGNGAFRAVDRKWIPDTDFLRNLNTLQYNGLGIWEEILATGRIRRLGSAAIDVRHALKRHPDKGSITHLSSHGYYLQIYFGDVAVTDQFRNLQHVGTLYFSGAIAFNETWRERIDRVLISDLKNLVSMDVYGCLGSENIAWDQQSLSHLQTVHPKLRKLFVYSNCIWVLREGESIWKEHTLRRDLNSWDIVTGVYDNI